MGRRATLGNGTLALARDPGEIVQTAVPFGCSRGTPYAPPAHALRSTTRWRPAPRSSRSAASSREPGDRLVVLHRSALEPSGLRRRRRRRGRSLRLHLRRYGAGVLVNGRTQQSDQWTELAVLDGDAVVLVAAQSRINDPPLDLARPGPRPLVPHPLTRKVTPDVPTRSPGRPARAARPGRWWAPPSHSRPEPAPAAAPDEATVQAGEAVTVPVLANDTDDGPAGRAGEPPARGGQRRRATPARPTRRLT